MGYQSYIEGHAAGENLVPLLLEQGFRLEEQWLRTAHGFLTGILVINDGRIEGTEQWHTSFGFEHLIEALHQVRELRSVDMLYHGEEGETEGYGYHAGPLTLESCRLLQSICRVPSIRPAVGLLLSLDQALAGPEPGCNRYEVSSAG